MRRLYRISFWSSVIPWANFAVAIDLSTPACLVLLGIQGAGLIGMVVAVLRGGPQVAA